MKTLLGQILILFAFLLSARSDNGPLTLLDDTWSDGDRTDTALPEESAWFASNAGTTPTLSVEPGLLVGNVRIFETNTSSRLWITHFAAPGAPVELADGDTLKISLAFRAVNVATAPTTGRGLRIGLFNFSEPGAARVTADGFSTGSGGGAPGLNVTGYLLNQNFSEPITVTSPIQIMKRTDTANVNLMGASAVFTALGSGGGPSGVTGFRSGAPYLFEFVLKRVADAAEITCRFSDDAGWRIQYTAIDSANPTLRFDGLAIRPNSAPDTADTFQFTRCRAEIVPFQVRIRTIEFPTINGARITWDSLPGKTYQIEWRPSFGPNTAWTIVKTIVATEYTEIYEDPEAFFVPDGFYRVGQLP